MDEHLPILIIFFIIVSIAAAALFYSTPLYAIFIVSGLFVFVASFVSIDLGLTIIIIAMMFSPEINVAEVPKRSVVIRIEDIFLIVVFFSWIVRMAIDKELGLLETTPINVPIFCFIGASLISSVRGALLGRVTFIKSIFFSLKYTEYFLLFFMICNHIRTRKQIKYYLGVFVFVFILTAIYGFSQIGSGRISTPFEGKSSEPATYGGYIIIVGMVILSCAWHVKGIFLQLFLGGCFLFSIPPFLHSLSRASYMGIIPAFFAFFFWTKKNKFFLVIAVMLAMVISVAFMPDFVKNRVKETFTGKEKPIAGQALKLEESATERIDSWNRILLNKWPKQPLLGHGPGSLFVDGQYVTFLAENGFVGLLFFVWIFMTLFKVCFDNLKLLKGDDLAQGITIGFASGMVGLLVHALTANTFILIRVMEPLWFLAGIVVSLPKVAQENVG